MVYGMEEVVLLCFQQYNDSFQESLTPLGFIHLSPCILRI